ncbi:MAG: hypothetical protein RJA25_396 [Bacteroidota bacterium]|jgi:chromosome segregation ATPase
MYSRNIKYKLKQQRMHLVSTHNFLIKQHELKVEIMGLVRDSEEQLNQALQQENSPPDKVQSLREKLADDQRLYTGCRALIHELRVDIAATKKGIEKLKLKLHHILSPQKTCGFFKQKNDDSQSSSFSHQSDHITILLDKLFKGA